MSGDQDYLRASQLARRMSDEFYQFRDNAFLFRREINEQIKEISETVKQLDLRTRVTRVAVAMMVAFSAAVGISVGIAANSISNTLTEIKTRQESFFRHAEESDRAIESLNQRLRNIERKP